MRSKRHHRRKSNGSVLIIAILLAMIGAGLFGLHRWQQLEDQKSTAQYQDEAIERLRIQFNGNTYVLRDDLDTYLIMGTDEFQDTITGNDRSLYNNRQADFLMLMVVDRKTKEYTSIHLNRDTMVDIPEIGIGGARYGTVNRQLNLAYSFGSGGKDSCRNVAETVSNLLYQTPIEHYFAVTMDAIPVLNDLVGGVTVHVDEDLTAADPVLIEGQNVTLKGDQALHYVRARMSVSDGRNTSRMVRQRNFINGLYEQMMHRLKESDRFALTLANALADYTTSDLITDELAKLADQLKDYRFGGFVSIEGDATYNEATEHEEFYPDEDALRKLVVDTFFELQS